MLQLKPQLGSHAPFPCSLSLSLPAAFHASRCVIIIMFVLRKKEHDAQRGRGGTYTDRADSQLDAERRVADRYDSFRRFNDASEYCLRIILHVGR